MRFPLPRFSPISGMEKAGLTAGFRDVRWGIDP